MLYSSRSISFDRPTASMAFGSTSQFSSDAANSSPPCRSHFQKTVHLRDWWLTKPEPDDDRKTLGVAGFTCTSQQYRAERCFSSAPILKVYDFFELETVDSLCVILQGYINKKRTLESGFPSEVFDHFLIGFPPYWEEFCTSCPKRVYAAQDVSRVKEDRKDSIEGLDNFHDSYHGKVLHRDSYIVDMGVEDCEDTILSNKASTFQNASSLEIPHEHIIKAGHEVLCDRSSLTSEFEDDPCLKMNPNNNDVHCMKHDDVRNYPSSKNFKINSVDSYTVPKCLGISSRRVTRSMTKMDSSKNHSAQGSLVHDIINLDQATVVETENLGSSDIARKDTNDSLSNNKAVNAVDCGGTDFLHVGAPSSINAAARNWELQNSRSYQKGNSSSGCGVKCRSRKNISTSEGNLDEQNLKNISSNLSFVYENGSNEASTCSKDMVSRIKAKRKQNDQYVDVTEDLRIKLASQVGTSNPRKNNDADVSGESQIGTRSDLEAKHIKAECSDPLDPLSTTSMNVGGLVNGSTDNFNSASSIIDLHDDIVISRTNMKACRNKEKEAAGEVTNRVDIPDKRGAFKAAAAKQGIVFKEATLARNKSKRKLKSGSSSCELTKRQRRRSPKSTKSMGKGSKDRYGSAKILSPESFSGKKSRSGRVLLPALEFWRNQTVVYDADRQVTGVLEGTNVTQASRDISEDNKELNKKARKTCKP